MCTHLLTPRTKWRKQIETAWDSDLFLATTTMYASALPSVSSCPSCSMAVPHWGKGWCCWGECDVMDDKPSTASEWGRRNHYTVVAYWKQSEPLIRNIITPACVPATGHTKNLLQPFLFQWCSSLWQKGQYWKRRRTNFEQKQFGPETGSLTKTQIRWYWPLSSGKSPAHTWFWL